MKATRPHMLAAIVALACCVSAVAPARGGPGVVTSYPLPAIYPRSDTFSLTANGRSVPVVGFSKQYDYAVFSLAGGPCKIEVARLDRKPITKHAISPMKLNLAGAAAGAKLAFTIDKPAYLIVAIDDLRKLVIAIDPPETDKPAAGGQGIYNVAAAPYSADRTGGKPATAAIQRAVDDAGKDPGRNGVVYVPNGVYHLTQLRLVSNVTLYLEPGAVLRLSGNSRDDFTIRYKKNSQNRHGTWFIHTADGATNVKILGRGTIDGDGKRLEKAVDLTSHVVVPMNCTGFLMDGPVVRDSGLWGVVVANSRDVRLTNTKHFNHLDMGENDCVDVCNSQDVTVARSIGISLDDPYSTKTWDATVDISKQWTGEFLANRNVTFDDCLSWTRCFAFKIGAGVWKDQERVAIRNCVAYDSAHAIGVSHSYGSGDVRDVLVENLDVERNTMTNLGRSWARFVIDKRKPDGGRGGGVYGVVVRNVTVRDAGTDPVPVKGLSEDQRINGLTFENITMPGREGPAVTLAEIGVNDSTFARDVTINGRAATHQVVEGSIHSERAQ